MAGPVSGRRASEAATQAGDVEAERGDENPRSGFKAQVIDVHTGTPEVFLRKADAGRLGLHPLDRVRVLTSDGHREEPAMVNISEGLVQPGVAGLSVELALRLGVETAQRVLITRAPRPRSVEAIRSKLDGSRLDASDIRAVIGDIAARRLTSVELTAWACAIQVHGMDLDETVACVEAMVETGERIRFDRSPVVDVHSIGGVPGNKYAPLCVPIVASHGVFIPKTSSRAISSACGTADFMEVVTPVALSAKDIHDITVRVGGTLAWGGAVNLAPADDEIIRVEYPLSLDPPSQLLASVLSKKVAVGATEVLIDIPTGAGAKVPNEAAARRLARDFITVGERVGLNVQCVVSQGDRPIGRTIGPVLEIQEALRVLEGAAEPRNLIEKACTLSGRLLEMAQRADPGKGYAAARRTLESGKALAKFREIIQAQGGDPSVKADALEPAPARNTMKSPRDGPVMSVDTRALVRIARTTGAPQDKGAGILLHAEPGDVVENGQALYTLHAQHEDRLDEAVALARRLKPFLVGGADVFGFVE